MTSSTSSTSSSTDKGLAARQIYRFRKHLLKESPKSKKLELIDLLDPGYTYLGHLGWDKQDGAEDDEEKWRPSWDASPNGVGQFGSWMNGSFKRWRADYVKAQAQSQSEAETKEKEKEKEKSAEEEATKLGAAADEAISTTDGQARRKHQTTSAAAAAEDDAAAITTTTTTTTAAATTMPANNTFQKHVELSRGTLPSIPFLIEKLTASTASLSNEEQPELPTVVPRIREAFERISITDGEPAQQPSPVRASGEGAPSGQRAAQPPRAPKPAADFEEEHGDNVNAATSSHTRAAGLEGTLAPVSRRELREFYHWYRNVHRRSI
ncbi:hypothetical protein QIS74_04924 [Colletotrichum tabaci]|uniref:Uncharacterized protein n=1 Tax=Colletotrichum tabaci TaxID=1209068 RepID=A0AAV9TH35_9PEZI